MRETTGSSCQIPVIALANESGALLLVQGAARKTLRNNLERQV